MRGTSRKTWTEQERRYASQAKDIMSLDTLKQEVRYSLYHLNNFVLSNVDVQLSRLHAGGVKRPNEYIRIHSSICQG